MWQAAIGIGVMVERHPPNIGRHRVKIACNTGGGVRMSAVKRTAFIAPTFRDVV
jgi:hypothetical protein